MCLKAIQIQSSQLHFHLMVETLSLAHQTMRIYVQQHTPQMRNSGDATHTSLGFRVRVRVKDIYISNPNANLNTNLNANP
jgi:hypothetical protein